jgi:O-antigen/teichoic acid export membrane protein
LIARRVLLAALSNWSAKIIALAVGFLLTPFLVHQLGDAQYGLLILVGSVVGQGAILDLGIAPAVIKYVAEHHARREHDQLRSLIATALALYSCLGLFALLLTVAIAPFFPVVFNVPLSDRDTSINVLLLMGVQLAISIPCTTSSAVLWGLHRYELAGAISVLGTLVSAAIQVLILLLGGGIIELAAATLPLTLATQAITVWCIRRVAPELHFTWRGARRELVRTVLSFSTPMLAIDLAYRLQTQTDEILSGAVLPVSSVTPYSIARKLGGLPQLAEQALAGFLPVTSQLQAEGEMERLRALYLVGSRITLAMSAPVAGVLLTLAGPLLTLWIGAEYAKYAPVVVILALASAAEVSHWPGQVILQGLARHHGLAIGYICAAGVKIGLSILLLRTYGLLGMAVATLIPTLALSFGYIFPYVIRVLRVPVPELLKQVLVPVLAPALLMIVFLYGITRTMEPSGLFSTAGIAMSGLALYSFIYISFFAGEAERELLRNLLAKATGVLSWGRALLTQKKDVA